MYQILIVEDDPGLNQGVAFALKGEGTAFFQSYTLEEAERIWRREQIDMILLDVNLPDGSGYTFLKKIRDVSQIPVLLLTANDLETDEVTGFALGADDYITKPFSLMALRARVDRMRVRSQREQRLTDREMYLDSRYRFYFETMQFWADGREIDLSKTEQRLLRCLVRYPQQTLSRERLSELIWPEGAGYVDENALSVAVNRLRRKLEGDRGACPIQTVYGIGYVWEERPVKKGAGESV